MVEHFQSETNKVFSVEHRSFGFFEEKGENMEEAEAEKEDVEVSGDYS